MARSILLSVPEAEKYSDRRLTASQLRGAVRTGRLPTVVLSKNKLIPIAALDALIDEVERASARQTERAT